MPFLTAGGHRLEYVWLGPPPSEAPTIVFLHEGLGSITQWRDFPHALCQRTGCSGLVYNRWGHGGSDPLDAARPVHFMHDEALVTLPEVLAACGVTKPVLLGHSDGASIALIYASAATSPPLALVLLAPHVFVEDMGLDRIRLAREQFETTDLKTRMARHHGANTDSVFYGWNDVWLRPAFRAWNIESTLVHVTFPVLVVQGEDDEYGTLRQVDAIAAAVPGGIQSVIVPSCGHRSYIDQRQIVEDSVVTFLAGTVL